MRGCHRSISPPVPRLSVVAVTLPVTRALRVALAEYNAQEKRRVFDSEWLTCQVCLTSKLGREFEPLVGCGHPFCRECLEQHFRIQVESGATLCCPQEGCTAQALPTQVCALLLLLFAATAPTAPRRRCRSGWVGTCGTRPAPSGNRAEARQETPGMSVLVSPRAVIVTLQDV